jgi:hypothetical protein
MLFNMILISSHDYVVPAIFLHWCLKIAEELGERERTYYFFSLGLDGLRSGCYASSENEIGEIWVL